MRILMVWLLFFAVVPLVADTITLDFEGFPDSTVLTTQYPGVTFTNAVILSAGISLNEFEFPPHSGTNVVSDDNGPMTITFATPVVSFGGYFTYAEPLTIQGFNAASSQVASAASLFSTNDALYGDPGSSPNEFIQVASAAGIASVTITGDPLGGSFALDDAMYNSSITTPEPRPTSLLAFAFLLLGGLLWVNRAGLGLRRSGLILISPFLLLPRLAFSQSTILTAPTLNPPSIATSAPAQITATAQINDPKMIAGSANLIRVGNGVSSIVGVMHDDGLNGDLIAGDGVYALVFTESPTVTSNIQYRVSVADKGSLMRTSSSAATLVVTEDGQFSAPTNVVFYNDLGDPDLFSLTAADGSQIQYFGTKDAAGLPQSITSEVINTNGQQMQYTVGSDSQLSQIIGPNGTIFQFLWTSDSTGQVVVTSSSSKVQVSLPLAANSSPAFSSSSRNVISKSVGRHVFQPNDSAPAGTAYARVTGCSGLVPVDYASVTMNYTNALLGRSLPMTAIGFGTGEYSVSIPSGAQSTAGIQQIINQFTSTLGSSCSELSDATNALGPTFCPSLAAAVVAGDFIARGAQELDYEQVVADCESLATAADRLCSAPDLVQKLVDIYDQSPISLQPIATVPGKGTLTVAPITGIPPNGPFPTPFSIDFPTLCVSSLTVSPASDTLFPLQGIQLSATARDSNGNLIQLPSSFVSWTSSDSTVASVDPSAGEVSAIAPGGPVQVEATEQTSHKTGAAMITVLQRRLSLTVTWTVTPIAPNGWSGTNTLTVNNGNWTYSGTLTNLNSGCPVVRTESGSGTIYVPPPPIPPATYTIFDFANMSLGTSWINDFSCMAPQSGGSNVPAATIIATPSSNGDFTLSTNTVFSPNEYYGNSQMTVTATGSYQ